ncbi:MAG: hypothetical protein JOZ25_06105 [Actinobacteria bacterium]|nr:hypothetical protein [Actinomycetota bacterium]
MPRRLVATLLAALVAALAAAAPAMARRHGFPHVVVPSQATYQHERAHFLSVAKKGILNARLNWWNPHEQWYNDRLDDQDTYPQATVWSLAGLFEAIDGVEIAEPSKQNREAVREFADHAERYWNGNLLPHGGWSPYPGDHGVGARVWFDDNSWWGHGFLDAYRATGNSRYLQDAERASDFVDARGWSGDGMWWDTDLLNKSDEALGAAAALSAEIYQETGARVYLDRARKYIDWANGHIWNGDIYGTLTYANGAFIGAHLAICERAHDSRACARARYLGKWAMRWWGKDLNKAPQFDTILLRYMMQLGSYMNEPKYYAWAYRNAERALRNAKTRGLYLNFWDGSPATDHPSTGISNYGQILTHGATIELFSWIAAVKPPQG